MCGIAGFVGNGDTAVVEKMIHLLSHRGPDYIGSCHMQNVGLGHARLSIIDLDARSNQPFFSSDRRECVVFNGEIYNYRSLREELRAKGKYVFHTESDTEVLLIAYREYGIQCLEKIHGMFAFAIYDFSTRELFMARDRMGKKPLYYTITDQTLVFASELKSVIAHPQVRRQLNPDALNAYLTFDYVPSPESIFSGIHKLPASGYLIFSEGKVKQQGLYWQVSFAPRNISFKLALEELDSLLQKAVDDRMISDVPLGVFLSGGLDSSTVAYYAQKNATQRIKTFSIGFSEKSFDESDYARLVARHLNTEHHEKTITAKDSLELLPVITTKLDEPFADPSIIPTYFLSAFTRSHVTVALGGDGSDELLAGYPTFISEIFAGTYRKLPAFVREGVVRVASLLPPSDKNISLDFKINQFLKGFEEHESYTHSLWLGSFTPGMKNSLFSDDFKAGITNGNGMGVVDAYRRNCSSAFSFDQLLYTYYRTYLLDDILVKVDRASMYNALEVRAPFMDTRVVEFLSALPASYKMKGFSGKYILKELMKDKLPQQVVLRPKKGFGIPVSIWLRNELKDMMLDMLSPQRIRKQGIFQTNYIEKMIREHLSCQKNHRKTLWNLLIFQLWMENYYQ